MKKAHIACGLLKSRSRLARRRVLGLGAVVALAVLSPSLVYAEQVPSDLPAQTVDAEVATDQVTSPAVETERPPLPEVAAPVSPKADPPKAEAEAAVQSQAVVAPSEPVKVLNNDDEDDDDDDDDDDKNQLIQLSGHFATSKSKKVKMEGSQIILTKGGSYSLKGKSEGLQLLVAEGITKSVRLTLNNISMTNNNASILSKGSAKLKIILAKGSLNSLSDSAANSDEAVISAAGSLSLSGSGSLTVTSQAKHAIQSNRSVSIDGGNYQLTAVTKDGINAVDRVDIEDANLTITAGDDAIVAENKETAHLGNVDIEDSAITINAKGDAIHASNKLTVDGGRIDVQSSREGLEGKVVEIKGGDITIRASDDGINAAVGRRQIGEEIQVHIRGGNIKIWADADGIDSNGSISISGGNLFIQGPSASINTAIDYDLRGEMSGGRLLAIGSNGMLYGFSKTTKQNYLIVAVHGKAGDLVTIKDKTGKVIASEKALGDFQNVIYSAPELVTGQEYLITTSIGAATTIASTDNPFRSKEAPPVV